MYQGKLVFAQLIDHLPMHSFRRCVVRYRGEHSIKSFSCQDQFRAMAFAQLTYRESLRDTITCLEAQSAKLYHMGFRSPVARSTLADANERRDWRLHAAFAEALIAQARKLYAGEAFGVDLEGVAYALDTTTIDLCLSLFPWAHFQRTKAAVKVHTQMDLRGNIPTFLHIDDGKSYDSDILDVIVPEAGAIYIMDRGYMDFARLHRLTQAAAFFVIRARSGLKWRRVVSQPVDKTTGVQCDQTITLTAASSLARYPDRLRRVRYRDLDTASCWCSSPTTSSCPHGPSPISTAVAGRSSCSSSGSSRTCGSSRSSASARTRSERKSGSRSPSMCWSRSSRSACIWTPASTQFCKV